MNRRKFLAGLAAAATSTKLAAGLPTGLLAKAIDGDKLTMTRGVLTFRARTSAAFIGTGHSTSIGEVVAQTIARRHAQLIDHLMTSEWLINYE